MYTRVLVIDNTLSNWDRSECLAKEEFDVETVRTFDAGLQKLHDQRPDVIIVQEKPEAESWHLCEEIRRVSNRPLMVISPSASAQTSAKALNAGADYFIRNSFGPMEFSARIKSLVRRIR